MFYLMISSLPVLFFDVRLSTELAELRKEAADRDSESRAIFSEKLQKQQEAMEEAQTSQSSFSFWNTL